MVFEALSLAVAQNDATIARQLCTALELALTRDTGGANFLERRSDFPDSMRLTLEAYDRLCVISKTTG